MAAHISWNGHNIGGLERGAIRAYRDFTFSMTTKTKARDGNGVLYVGRQGYNAIEAQVTLELRAALGDSVEEAIEAFKRDSRNGVCARLLVSGRDMFGADFLLTGADVSQTEFQPVTGKMTRAELKLTWQETDGQVYDNTSSSSGSAAASASGSKGSSSKYLKKSGGSEAASGDGAAGGGSSASGGNLTGMAGGYNTSGVSAAAKKIDTPCSSTRKDSAVRVNKTIAASK